MPTKRLMPVTSLAVVLELGILRNRSRSKARPRSGPRTTTESRKATPHRQVLVLDQLGEGIGRDVGLGAVGEVEDPGGLVGEDQADGHDGVGAPVGDSGDGEAEEVLHSLSPPIGSGRRRAAHAPGVPRAP